MSIRSWICQLFGMRSQAATERRRPFRHTSPCRRRGWVPTLELLEDRLVPTTFSPTGVPEVTSLSDSGNGSLRQLVQQGWADITFAPGLAGTITLTSGELRTVTNLTLIGTVGSNGLNNITVSGFNHSRILDVGGSSPAPAGDTALQSVTIENVDFEDGFANAGNGGAILNFGDLTLIQSTVSGSTALGANGSYAPANSDEMGAGGAIYNGPGASLWVQDSTISGNSSQGGAGTSYSTDAAVQASKTGGGGGGGGAGMGGGIFNAGNLYMVNSTVSGNAAIGGDGGNGYRSLRADAYSQGGNGGGFGSTGTIGVFEEGLDTPSSDGGFGGGGGGGYGVGINGGNTPGLSGHFGGGGGGGGAYTSFGTFGDSVVAGGAGGFYGGHGGAGGASGGSGYSGGGGGGAGIGGGIFNAGNLSITASTISGNSAIGATGGGDGGGAGKGAGGGLFTYNANATLDSTVIAGNYLGGPAGGVSPDARVSYDTISVRTSGGIPTITFNPSCFLSGSYNLIGNTSGANGLAASNHNILGVNNSTPLVQDLAGDGGPTPTMPPLRTVTIGGTSVANPLLGAGDPNITFTDLNASDPNPLNNARVTVDQIGNPRGTPADIGAVQFEKTSQAITGFGLFNNPNPPPISFAPGETLSISSHGGGSGNPVVVTLDKSSTGAIISGSTSSQTGTELTVTGPGTIILDANEAGNAFYAAAPQVQLTLVVNKANQTITFSALAPIFIAPNQTVTLSASGGASGNPVIFSIDPSSSGQGIISGNKLTVTGAGNIVIDANQAGNTNYAAATQVQRTLAVMRLPQTINFTAPASPISIAPNQTVALSATGGSSSNPIVFSIDPSSTGQGTISGNLLSVTGAGTFVIDANLAANTYYNAAPQVQRTLVVNQRTQTISFSVRNQTVTILPNEIVPLVAFGGGSNNPVVFTIDPSSTGKGSINGNTLSVTGAGTLVIDANQAGNTYFSAAPQVQQMVDVVLGKQAITFSAPASPITFAAGATVHLSAAPTVASGIPIILTIDKSSTGAGAISGNTLTVTGAGTIVIDANQAANTFFSAAPQVQQTLVVNPASQTITFTPPVSPINYAVGETVTLSATGGASGIPIVFTIDKTSTGAGAISGNTLTVTGVGTIVIDANQAGNANYIVAAQVQQTLVVNQGSQAINFTPLPSSVAFANEKQFVLHATGGGSGKSVVYTIDPSSTGTGFINLELVGGSSTVTAFVLNVNSTGTFVIDANQAGNANFTAAPQVQQTVVITPGNQTINFSAPASPVTYGPNPITLTVYSNSTLQVNLSIDPSSTGTGVIVPSNPNLGRPFQYLTVTSAGTFVLDANQAGNSNWNPAAQVQQTLVVNKATPTLTGTPSATSVQVSTALVTLKDTAVLAGGNLETGTISFTLAIGGNVVDTETVAVNGAGTYTTPTGYTVPVDTSAAGTYQWNIAYSGDANHNAVSDTNDAKEQVAVTVNSSNPFGNPPPVTEPIFPPPVDAPITFTTTALPAWTINTPYTANIQTTGGAGAVTFALVSGSFPPGLTLSSTGAISGLCAVYGSFTFTVTATDSLGEVANLTLTMSLTAASTSGQLSIGRR